MGPIASEIAFLLGFEPKHLPFLRNIVIQVPRDGGGILVCVHEGSRAEAVKVARTLPHFRAASGLDLVFDVPHEHAAVFADLRNRLEAEARHG